MNNISHNSKRNNCEERFKVIMDSENIKFQLNFYRLIIENLLINNE
jgi:hypothetical protein